LTASVGGDSKPPAVEARVSCRVHAGLHLEATLTLGAEVGVIFGRSGAGKTTLLRMLAGLRRPDSGLVRLGGEVVFDSDRRVDLPLRSRRVGLVFQDDLLFPHLGVAANVGFGLRGWPRADAARRVAKVADLCGVEALLGRRPSTLSGGERQRVGLARALAPRPRLLLCDEPVSALDQAGRRALIARLKAVQAAERLPVLYVTHSPTEAVALGHRLFLLADGVLGPGGPPLDVLAAAGLGFSDSGGTDGGGFRNAFAATVVGPDALPGGTVVRLRDGPDLVVPPLADPPGTAVEVVVAADDVVLAVGPVAGLSARNLVPGVVTRVVPHGVGAEVLVSTGGVTWVVGVVAPAVEALGLLPGLPVRLIVKARGCRVGPAGP